LKKISSNQPPFTSLMEDQKITSFIIRFFHNDPSEGEKFHRGVISHVQDGEELGFTHWTDAVDFIRRFVPLDMGKGTSQVQNEKH
jgi:hypothetical protein